MMNAFNYYLRRDDRTLHIGKSITGYAFLIAAVNFHSIEMLRAALDEDQVSVIESSSTGDTTMIEPDELLDIIYSKRVEQPLVQVATDGFTYCKHRFI
jgi:hypothetical protein